MILYLVCALVLLATPLSAAAAVCGNATLEAGEQCDDGNQANGDCCSSTCQYEPNDSPYDDGDDCTVDACITGRCAGSSLCDDGASCTMDICLNGECRYIVVHGF